MDNLKLHLAIQVTMSLCRAGLKMAGVKFAVQAQSNQVCTDAKNIKSSSLRRRQSEKDQRPDTVPVLPWPGEAEPDEA
jgi:hypothetical protein